MQRTTSIRLHAGAVRSYLVSELEVPPQLFIVGLEKLGQVGECGEDSLGTVVQLRAEVIHRVAKQRHEAEEAVRLCI